MGVLWCCILSQLQNNNTTSIIHKLSIHTILPQHYQDIVIYGFGRIGRIITRLLFDSNEFGLLLRLRAIVVRLKKNETIDTIKRMNLLNYDSIHGTFKGCISIQDDHILINDQKIQLLFSNSPTTISYQQYGINNAILIDNTGVWRDKQGLSQHLSNPSISSVIVTAPGNDIPNLVYGVNKTPSIYSTPIVSAASCTTNAIVPVLSLIHNKFRIQSGHIETIHSYTNDQNLLDNYHKKWR